MAHYPAYAMCSTVAYQGLSSLASDSEWAATWRNGASTPVAQGKKCSYCGRYAVVAQGNCEGCAAPLDRREIKRF